MMNITTHHIFMSVSIRWDEQLFPGLPNQAPNPQASNPQIPTGHLNQNPTVPITIPKSMAKPTAKHSRQPTVSTPAVMEPAKRPCKASKPWLRAAPEQNIQ